MLVRAKEACFIDGHRRRPGAVFEYAGDVLPAHLVAVKGAEPKPQPEIETPVALSQMGEGRPKSFIESVAPKKK